MANKDLTKMYRLISKQLQKLEQAIEREKFFGQCLSLKLVPNTFLVKPPTGATTKDEKIKNLFKNAAVSSSFTNLRIAFKDSKEEIKAENEKFESLVGKLIEESNSDVTNVINDYIHKRRPQLKSQAANTFAQKLTNLRRKRGDFSHSNNESVVTQPATENSEQNVATDLNGNESLSNQESQGTTENSF